MKEMIADRITLMMLSDEYPKYLFNARMCLFSKIGDEVVESIDQIRPIGILPLITKIIEKTWKKIVDEKLPKLLEVGKE